MILGNLVFLLLLKIHVFSAPLLESGKTKARRKVKSL